MWPADLSDLDVSGLYSWWTDDAGAAELGEGLDSPIEPGRVYVGQTGATRWPSGIIGRATLRKRISSNHLGGNIRGSTFRLTLAGVLACPLALTLDGPKRLTPEAEARLTEWMCDHLSVAVHRFPERDPLSDLESRVLDTLDPPLNLDGRALTPARTRLAGLRSSVGASLAP